MSKHADWKKIYDILSDLLCQRNTTDLERTLAENIGDLIPYDQGMPLFELRDNLPYCVSWPGYSDSLIPKFNSHFAKVCPVPYRTDSMELEPVSWKRYCHTEYDTDFNRPLGIGHSMGFGFEDPIDKTATFVALNRGRRSRPFSRRDLLNFVLIIQQFGKLYVQKKACYTDYEQKIMHASMRYGIRPLSKREIEICQLLCRRYSAGRIARILSISPRTVETHCLHIYNKMNVGSCRELLSLIVSGEDQNI